MNNDATDFSSSSQLHNAQNQAGHSAPLVSPRRLWSRRNDPILWWLIGISALLGVIYNGVVMIGFGPDEPRHMAYVRLLVEEGRLPFLQADGSEYKGAHSLHPPLYYALLSPIYFLTRALPGETVWHLARLVSALLCLMSLVLIYDIALQASGRREVARLTVAHLGWLPIFGMTAGIVNNDAASLLAVALFVWLLTVRFEARLDARRALILGACLGVGALCKATVVIADVAALGAVGWVRGDWKRLQSWAHLALVGAASIGVSGAWYARSFQLYGQFSPIESGYTHPALPNPTQGALVMMLHDNFPALFAYANWGIFYSAWSQKDWFPLPIRTPIYALLAAYTVAAIIGHGKTRRLPKTTVTSDNAFDDGAIEQDVRRATRWAMYGAFALNWAACVWMALFRHWGWAEGGRYLLASMGGLALFLAIGWQALLGTQRLPKLLGTWCVWALLLNNVAIYWLLSYLNPTFGPR